MYNEFILFLILFLALCIQLFKQLHQCSPYFSEVGHYCYFHLTYKESEAKRLRNLTNHIADKCWHQNSGSTGLASEFMLINMMAPLSMEFSRQRYWNGQPFPSPGDLPSLGIEPRSLALQADSLPSEPPGNQNTGKIREYLFVWVKFKP